MKPSKPAAVAEAEPVTVTEVVLSPEMRKGVIGALRAIDDIKAKVFDAPRDATLVITVSSR